ncbi:MAG: PqqD family peptide modification chaperone [Pseudomonadota bacterium]
MNSSALDPTAKYVRATDVVSTDMNGEIVMMHIEKGSYFSLTGTGGPIWDRLETAMTFAELSESLGSEFDLESDSESEAQVREFFEKLVAEGLVVVAA